VTKIARLDSGRLLVTLLQNVVDENGHVTSTRTFDEEFDTVLSATGRGADTAGLNLSLAGVVATTKGIPSHCYLDCFFFLFFFLTS
jgi:hypothetical protein